MIESNIPKLIEIATAYSEDKSLFINEMNEVLRYFKRNDDHYKVNHLSVKINKTNAEIKSIIGEVSIVEVKKIVNYNIKAVGIIDYITKQNDFYQEIKLN